MDWLTGFSIVAIMSGVTISVVVLVAVGSIRRSLNEGAARQSQQIRRLSETVATLTSQQQAAQTRIQQLTEANRRLTEEFTALGERLSDAETVQRVSGSVKLLH
jgi:DNA anti-recombination protein RmuC